MTPTPRAAAENPEGVRVNYSDYVALEAQRDELARAVLDHSYESWDGNRYSAYTDDYPWKLSPNIRALLARIEGKGAANG